VTREYEISLVTPLFGGGVEAGKPDESMPIRATSIRGQLQFWWRATRGARFADHSELFARHAEIWGTTERASPLEVVVRNAPPDKLPACAEYKPRNEADDRLQLHWNHPFNGRELPYALFPFQGQLSRDWRTVVEPPATFIETAAFTLRLRYPKELSEDVETAVWAWVNFGGLGARTRRGCGALLCKELAAKNVGDLERWFGSGVFKGGGAVREWPTMPDVLLVGKQEQAPIDAWKQVIGCLQKFRQGEEVGRNRGSGNRPGRSRWPEPETIRRVTERRSPRHARLAHIPNDAFPRAEFGLPIVFHFQGEGEPPDTVLYPLGAERMASPLILKPLALANGKAVPLILQLISPSLTGVELKRGSTALELPDTTVVRARRLAIYRDSPLSASHYGSAVEAFLAYARNNGFEEITR
jgi:CRISPR-associated protein Cmr1